MDNIHQKAHPRIVPPYSDFIRLFTAGAAGNSGLVLIEQQRNDADAPQQKQRRSKKKSSSGHPAFPREKLERAQELVYDRFNRLTARANGGKDG